MKHKIRPLIMIIVLASAVGGGYGYFNRYPAELVRLQRQFGFLSPTEIGREYEASGFIEAEEISLAAETGGRITRIMGEEGDYVEAGAVLVQLDTTLLDTEIGQTQAKISTAKAHLAKIKAGVRDEEIAKAEAGVTMAAAKAEAAHILWENALMLRDNPQELDMQIDVARTTLDLAELQIAYAIPLKDVGESLWELRRQQWTDTQEGIRVGLPSGKSLHVEFPEGAKQSAGMVWNLAGTDMWAAWVDLNTAQIRRDHTQTALNDLLRLRNDPQTAQIKVDEAEATYRTALVEIEAAQAQLAVLEAGTRPETIAVAQAQVEQAEATLAMLRVRHDKHTLVAPAAGWVVERVANEGEMALPGASLLTVADLSEVTLTVYVPELDVDTIALGQMVDVFVDAFPGKPFSGRVTFINSEAEYTPNNIQTKEERVNTVFGVKIKLDNADRRLKPGMPADAVLSKGLGF